MFKIALPDGEGNKVFIIAKLLCGARGDDSIAMTLPD